MAAGWKRKTRWGFARRACGGFVENSPNLAEQDIKSRQLHNNKFKLRLLVYIFDLQKEKPRERTLRYVEMYTTAFDEYICRRTIGQIQFSLLWTSFQPII